MVDEKDLVTQAQCQRLHTDISTQLTSQAAQLTRVETKVNSLDTKVSETNERLREVCNDVYGSVERGEQKGGLVILVRDINKKLDPITDDLKAIRRNGGKSLSRRDKAAIMVAVIGGTFGLITTIITVAGGH